MKRIIGFLFLAIVVFLVVLAFIYRSTVGDFLYFARKEPLPAPLAAKDIKKQNSQTAPLVPSGAEGLPIIKDQAEEVAGPVPSAVEEPQVQEWEKANEAKMPLPAEINLAVPFTSQAPFANWDLPYKESCEEASVLMLDYFYRGASLNPALANQEILKIVDWQKIKFGAYEDTDAAQTAQILRDYFGYKNVRVSYDISIEDIKKELALADEIYNNYETRYKEKLSSMSDVIIKQSEQIQKILQLQQTKNMRNERIFALEKLANGEEK